MIDRHDGVSPQLYARIGGVLYLMIFALAFGAMALQSSLIVRGDAGATAAHIVAGSTQLRASVAAELVMFGCDIPLAVIFYVLLRPVDVNLSLLAAAWRFAEAVIGSLIVLLQFLPVIALSGAAYLKGLEPQQLQSLAYLSLKLYDYGFGIALIPFGLSCTLLGYLIFRSTYLPKTLGVLLVLAGIAYVINSFALFVAPGVSDATFIVLFVFALPAEVGLCLWLLIFGVNLQRWDEKTR